MALLLLVLSGCNSETDLANQYVYKEAVKIATKHYKQEENKDVIYQDFQILSSNKQIVLYGFELKNPDKKIETKIDYGNKIYVVSNKKKTL